MDVQHLIFRLTWMKQEQNLKILKQGGSLFEPNVSFLGLVFLNLTAVTLRTRISSGGMGSPIIQWQTTSSCGDCDNNEDGGDGDDCDI